MWAPSKLGLTLNIHSSQDCHEVVNKICFSFFFHAIDLIHTQNKLEPEMKV